MDEKSSQSTSSVDDTLQTSQQKAGEHHLSEGEGGGAGPSDTQYGSEDAPRKAASDPFQTSANLQGTLSLPEGD